MPEEVKHADGQEAELFERWRAGDERAGNMLFRRYRPQLQRFFYNKTSSSVDDLVQQTLIAAVGGRERFEGRSTFRAYLFSIARYTLYEHYRQNQRRDALFEFDTVTLFDVSPSPSSHMVERSEQRLLLEALRRIPINLQIALELHYWEDLRGPELAEILELPVDTVYSRLRRAKSLLKEKLRTLAASPEVLQDTAENLSSWAKSVRARASGLAARDSDGD